MQNNLKVQHSVLKFIFYINWTIAFSIRFNFCEMVCDSNLYTISGVFFFSVRQVQANTAFFGTKNMSFWCTSHPHLISYNAQLLTAPCIHQSYVSSLEPMYAWHSIEEYVLTESVSLRNINDERGKNKLLRAQRCPCQYVWKTAFHFRHCTWNQRWEDRARLYFSWS